MRRIPIILAVALLPLLGGCTAVGAGLAGLAAPLVLGTAQSYGEEVQGGIEAANQYRREQIERRRDFRALCHADILAERAFHLQRAAQAEDDDKASDHFARARQVLADAYPSLTETASPLGERDKGLCGAAVKVAEPSAPDESEPPSE